jgi:hypothetical protein
LRQRRLLLRVPPALHQADICQLEAKQGGRQETCIAEPFDDGLRTLTAIASRADQGGSLARGVQAKPMHLGKDVGGRHRSVLLDGGLDDCQQLALQGAVMPRGALAQAVNHPVGCVLDREVDGQGSKNAPQQNHP